VKAAQPLIPKNRRSNSKGIIWQQRMYTQIVADLYSEEWLAVSRKPRSAHDSFSQISHALADKRCRLVFVVVAFPPPPAYVPGNEARSPKTASGLRLL
jgi:hypothetical protein